MAILRTLTFVVALCLAAAPALFAQTAMATLRGKIVDEQGAVLPGVVVTVRAIDTNSTRSVTTTDIGEYLPAESPGRHV